MTPGNASGSLFDLGHVTAGFGPSPVLQDLSLTLVAERVVGVIGPNGSGKSTLLKVLARQLTPRSGSALFEGRPLASYGGRDFARRVAYMPQFTPAGDGLTVRELVALGRFPWHGPLGRFGPRDRAAVAEAIAACGLKALADRGVDGLSGGERQRAWLGAMLAQEPACLILDEPTAALDLAHQVATLDLVRSLARSRQLTAVIVLHDVNLAARVCDEIVALRSGSVVARGSPAAVMQPAILSAIFGVPIRILRDAASGHAVAHVA